MEDRIKNTISKNKDLVYDLWISFNDNYKEDLNNEFDKKVLFSIDRVVDNSNNIFNSNQVTLDMILGL